MDCFAAKGCPHARRRPKRRRVDAAGERRPDSRRGLVLEGGLKRQIRLLSEDFDDDLASRAEDLLE